MSTTFQLQRDEAILDGAASLFASRGLAKTTIQDVADAVGLSKAGLLHHFPSKTALHEAALGHAELLLQRFREQVGGMPLGVERDWRAAEVWVDVALDHPGLVALLLAPSTQGPLTANESGVGALSAFGVEPDAEGSERTVRVAGALAAVAVLAVVARKQGLATAWRGHMVATCFDALGHRRGPVSR